VEIATWMKHPVQTVKPLDTIQHAREIMEERRINQLPVVANGRLLGIVSDRDLRDAFPSVFDSPGFGGRKHKPGADPSKILIESVMSARLFTLGPKDSVVWAAQLMRRERIGAVPVVDAGRLVGILTRSDVLDAFVALAESKGSTERRTD
jgi:acetoin utilization protein AcuB